MNKKRCIHKIKNDCNQKTAFIILCGKKSNKKGYGNVPLTQINPKETIIDRQINAILNNYDNNEITLISGFEHDKIVNHIHSKKYENVRIIENQNYKSSTILDGWRIGLNSILKEDVYIIHGDRLFNESCICNSQVNNTHAVVHKHDKNNYNLGLLFDEKKLINISYGLPYVWSEIFYIKKQHFDLVRNTINNHRQKKIYNIESLINSISQKIEISVVQRKHKDIKILKEIK